MKKEKITKFSDFVYYYKWHVVAIVAVVLMIAGFVRDCATRVEDDLVVTALMSNYAMSETGDNIAADFVDAGIIPDIDGDGISKVYINLITIPLETKSEADMVGAQQAMIAMAADDSILFLVDEDLLEMYETQGIFDDMTDKAEKYNMGEDVYISEDGTMMGISLKNSEYLKSRGIVTDTLYACYRIMPDQLTDDAAKKLKAADDMLDYIMNNGN